MSLLPLVLQLIGGAIGGNVAGSLMKNLHKHPPWLDRLFAALSTLGAALTVFATSALSAQTDKSIALDGEWIYVEDRTVRAFGRG
ncbi:MAG: hypothetical protein ABL921_08645 [Pirellula sp.]